MTDVLTSNPPSLLFRKRKAENCENNERLSKRLSLLNLDRSGQIFVNPPQLPIAYNQNPISHDVSLPPSNSELMQIEDTKHKVFIHDLEAEILEAQSEEAKLIIHPDIKKHLRDICLSQQYIAPTDISHENNQLVLYNEPGSITIPEELDSVKRIIIETRNRIRGSQNTATQIEQTTTNVLENSDMTLPLNYHPNSIDLCIKSQQPQEYDPDIMDLDTA